MADTQDVQQASLTTQPQRLLGLDLLRAAAILLVLIAHCPVPEASASNGVLLTLLTFLKRGGWVGVDLFFVLSGFLVSGLLMREQHKHGTVRVGRFLVRRGWKIYPPLIVFVVFMVPLQRITLGYWPINRLIAQIFFVQSYTPGIQTHLWSLAVEEHAYLLIALAFGLCAFVAKRCQTGMSLQWLPWTIVATLVIVLATRVYNASLGGAYENYAHKFPTHLRIDSILAGVLLAYFYHYHQYTTRVLLKRTRPLLLIGGTLLILPSFIWTSADGSFVYTYGFTTNYLGGLLLLGGMLGCKPTNSLPIRTLSCIGRHSYSIYIWHKTGYYLLLCMLNGQLSDKPTWDGPYALNVLMFFGVAIVLGITLSILIEVPTLKLRDRLSPSRSGTLASIDGGGASKLAQQSSARGGVLAHTSRVQVEV